MSTIIIAVTVLAIIALIIGLLMFVHERDKRKDAIKKMNESNSSEGFKGIPEKF